MFCSCLRTQQQQHPSGWRRRITNRSDLCPYGQQTPHLVCPCGNCRRRSKDRRRSACTRQNKTRQNKTRQDGKTCATAGSRASSGNGGQLQEGVGQLPDLENPRTRRVYYCNSIGDSVCTWVQLEHAASPPPPQGCHTVGYWVVDNTAKKAVKKRGFSNFSASEAVAGCQSRSVRHCTQNVRVRCLAPGCSPARTQRPCRREWPSRHVAVERQRVI